LVSDGTWTPPRIGIALAQFLVQPQPLETLVAGLGQPRGGNVPDDRQPTQKAGEER